MAKEPPSNRTTQQMTVHGNAAGPAQVSGSNNTVTATGNVSMGAPPDVLQALTSIQAALSEHPATKVLTDAVVEQAKTDRPDKAAIGGQLKAALDVAKTSLGWAELAAKLAPHVRTAAAWLGGSWADSITV